ncbi:hypothetical protein [Nocardiopsis sp. CNT312]|uniref:hypothetical protein n=1 Tax=Nocardiopsis sp. CNT312 TaxID=1137268 RepID=UPI00048BEE74|nr:hypothetical protein [Nocardiopsis sp. CNT312]
MLKFLRPLTSASMTVMLTLSGIALSSPVQAQDTTETRKKFVECVNKDISKENAEWKLPESELKKLKNIIDREIMKEDTLPKSQRDEQRIIENIENAAAKELPGVDRETLDEVVETLRASGQHCFVAVRQG